MDVFDLRHRVVDDYSAYVKSFISILDARIRQRVERELAEGLLWPDPRVGLNPSFEPGARIDGLVREGLLHAECSKIVRIGNTRPVSVKSGPPVQDPLRVDAAFLHLYGIARNDG